MRSSLIKVFALCAVPALFLPAIARAEVAEPRTLRVTVDKAEVIKVDGTASVVLVANPQIADVVVERNQLVFVVGRRPGETRLYIYSASGKPLLEREIVVVPQGDRSVTVIRDTQPTSYSCDPRCIAVGQRPTGSGTTSTGSAPTPLTPTLGPTAAAQ
jgi:Flp pilus assembly secretin CpaC